MFRENSAIILFQSLGETTFFGAQAMKFEEHDLKFFLSKSFSGKGKGSQASSQPRKSSGKLPRSMSGQESTRLPRLALPRTGSHKYKTRRGLA